MESGTSVIDEFHRLGEYGRLVGQGDAGVHVEHVRPGLDLGDGIALDSGEVPITHLLGEELASGRVDALTDDDEWIVEAHHDFFGLGSDDGPGHATTCSFHPTCTNCCSNSP